MTELRERGPAAVEEWLERVQQGIEPAPDVAENPNFWLFFAEPMGFDARTAAKDGDIEKAMLWAKAAQAVYHWMAASVTRDVASKYEVSSEMLRASLIRQCGHRLGHWFLDPQHVYEWFLRVAPMSVEEAQQLATKPISEQSLVERLRLREAKNCLRVVKLVSDSGGVEVPENIQKWLSVKNL